MQLIKGARRIITTRLSARAFYYVTDILQEEFRKITKMKNVDTKASDKNVSFSILLDCAWVNFSFRAISKYLNIAVTSSWSLCEREDDSRHLARVDSNVDADECCASELPSPFPLSNNLLCRLHADVNHLLYSQCKHARHSFPLANIVRHSAMLLLSRESNDLRH